MEDTLKQVPSWKAVTRARVHELEEIIKHLVNFDAHKSVINIAQQTLQLNKDLFNFLDAKNKFQYYFNNVAGRDPKKDLTP